MSVFYRYDTAFGNDVSLCPLSASVKLLKHWPHRNQVIVINSHKVTPVNGGN